MAERDRPIALGLRGFVLDRRRHNSDRHQSMRSTMKSRLLLPAAAALFLVVAFGSAKAVQLSNTFTHLIDHPVIGCKTTPYRPGRHVEPTPSDGGACASTGLPLPPFLPFPPYVACHTRRAAPRPFSAKIAGYSSS